LVTLSAFCVDDGDGSFVLEIDVEGTLTIGSGCLGFAAQIDFANVVSAFSVQHRDFLVHRKHALGERVVEYEIGAVDRHLLDDLQRLDVQDTDRTVATVGTESAIEVWRDGRAVNAGGIRNYAHYLPAVGVEDLELGIVGDIQSSVIAVEAAIVPPSCTADGVLAGKMVSGGRRGEGLAGPGNKKQR
jgi:hypothetical protein